MPDDDIVFFTTFSHDSRESCSKREGDHNDRWIGYSQQRLPCLLSVENTKRPSYWSFVFLFFVLFQAPVSFPE